MSRNSGSRNTPASPGGAPQVTAALRTRTPGWRDPRLWIGLVVVAGSVVAGSRLMAGADDTVPVWAAEADLGPGERLEEADLVARRVRFADAAGLDAYFVVADGLPEEAELTRPVGAGELLTRTAVGAVGATGQLHLPIAVDLERVPPSVATGSVVDVYLTTAADPDRPASAERDSTPVLAGVTVVDAPGIDQSFGVSGQRQLVLAVDEDVAADYFTTLGGADDAVLTVVRRS